MLLKNNSVVTHPLFKITDLVIKKELFTFGLYSFLTSAYATSILLLLFPQADKENILKLFPEKKKLYQTVLISGVFYVIYSLLFFASSIYAELGIISEQWPNYPFYCLLGMSVLVFSNLIAGIVVNIIIRDS